MVTFQRELAQDLIKNIGYLIELHYKEIARYQDIPLDPDFSLYLAAEAAGNLRCYTARMDSLLVGYSVFMVRRNLHYRSSLQAIQDILFVAPEYRKSRIGVRLIRFCDQ